MWTIFYVFVVNLLILGVSALQKSMIVIRNSRALSASSGDYGAIVHAGLLVSDVEKSIDFYEKAFGFEDVTHLRPKLPFHGAFLTAGMSQLHLMQLPNPDPLDGRPEHGGRDRHFAISCRPGTVDRLKVRLAELDHPYTMSLSGRAALFCRDLDMNAIEFMEVEDL